MPKYMPVLLVAALFSLAAKPHTPPPGVSLDPAQWLIHDSAWTPVTHPQPLSGMAGWFFDFPDVSDSVNYVMVPYTTPMLASQSITVTAQIVATSGAPVFLPAFEPGNTCDAPATTRIHFARTYRIKRAQTTVEEYSAPDNYRWWATSTAMLLTAGGVVTMTVPLDPAQWSDTSGVSGRLDPSGFAAAIADPGTIGLTFGSGCFWGHGVYADGGTARFIVTNYAVQ